MNILTFDIEEWAVAKDGGYGTPKLYARFDEYLNQILELLDDQGVKATFFCTGRMAQEFPNIVKLIQSQKHEIGCHSYHHTWMNKMTKEEAREDTYAAVTALEQCVGQKVLSYRAPAFSIGEQNRWMIDILSENGITRDSSVYPAKRDFGGFPAFGSQTPCILECDGISLKEYPISMTSLFGKQLAYSGGGYFRFFPFGFVMGRIANSDYTMCYFHIKDLLPDINDVPSKEWYETYYKAKGSLMNRYIRFFKSNIGKKGAWKKFENLIHLEKLISIDESDNSIDWNNAKTVII